MRATNMGRRRSGAVFSTTETVDVDIDLDEDDLAAEGWVYVGKDKVAGFEPARFVPEAEAVELVRAWHDREHPAAWVFCDQEPCKDLR